MNNVISFTWTYNISPMATHTTHSLQKLLLDFAHLTNSVGKGSSHISFKGEHSKTMINWILYIYEFSFGNTKKEIIFFSIGERHSGITLVLFFYTSIITNIVCLKTSWCRDGSFNKKLYFNFFLLFIF